MNWYEILTTVLWIVLGFIVSYLKTKVHLVDKAKDAIYYAEKEYKEAGSGGQKMQWAVRYLSSIVPAPLKFIFTESVIESIIQGAFDRIQEFATTQLDKITDKFDKE